MTGASPFTIYGGFLDSQLADLHIARNDLRGWQPKGRVDIAPLPRKAGRAGRTKPAPRAKVDIAFTAEQMQVVIDFAGQGPMTTAQAAEVAGLPATATRALLKQLVERGDLVQTGQRRGTKYELAGR
jgi:predicted Rossmann fold nucleotide-binding protein DprA/Smf involved in DNA uptake